MKKVGIMTYQFADNYGAVLQCYALRKAINQLEGCQAEIINYVPAQYCYRKYDMEGNLWRIKFLKKREKFNKFLAEECGIHEKTCSYVEGNQYDYYCAGSDQIWGPSYKMNEEYFFPHLDKCANKISYAASLGIGVEHNQIAISIDMIQRYVPEFKAVSVREWEHVDLIEELTGKPCECVVDPTLLLPAEMYENVISKTALIETDFIFFYWLPTHLNPAPGIEMANMLSRRYHIPVIHSVVGAPDYMFARDGGCMFYEGIEDFLWYVKNAKFVVTDSYHGTIFAMQFRRPFYTFVYEAMKSRIDTLTGMLGIEERIVGRYIAPDRIEEEIDFDGIHHKMNKERQRSLQYLRTALDIAE